MATHSCILVWRILWTKEPKGLQTMGSQRINCLCSWVYNSFTSFLFCLIRLQLTFDFILVSDIQHNDSVIYICKTLYIYKTMCIKYVYNIYCAATILPDLEMHTSLAVPLLLILNSIVCILEKKNTKNLCSSVQESIYKY